MLVQWWPSVCDADRTLNQHWVNIPCYVGIVQYRERYGGCCIYARSMLDQCCADVFDVGPTLTKQWVSHGSVCIRFISLFLLVHPTSFRHINSILHVSGLCYTILPQIICKRSPKYHVVRSAQRAGPCAKLTSIHWSQPYLNEAAINVIAQSHWEERSNAASLKTQHGNSGVRTRDACKTGEGEVVRHSTEAPRPLLYFVYFRFWYGKHIPPPPFTYHGTDVKFYFK